MNWCLQSVYVCSAFLEKLGNARTFFLPVHRWKFRQAGSLLLNRCSHLDLRPPVLRGKVSDNIHISCLSGLCFCEFLIELSPSVEWRGFPKVLLRKELTAAAWKKKEAFGSRHHHHHHYSSNWPDNRAHTNGGKDENLGGCAPLLLLSAQYLDQGAAGQRAC